MCIHGQTDADTAALTAAYQQILSTRTGAGLEFTLESSATIYTITNVPGVPAQFISSTNTISLDPNFTPVLQTTDGPQVASTDILLAHELGHAVTGLPDEGPMNVIDAVENSYRADLGLPARTAYTPVAYQPFGSPPYTGFQFQLPSLLH